MSYVFDLDGTLANIDHRLHFIRGETKDWKSFFAACVDDKPIVPTIEILNALVEWGNDIWIVTGRSEEVRQQTVEWLNKYVVLSGDYNLIMRKEGDYRSDVEIKREWFQLLGCYGQNKITAVFEDRANVVKMWRELGLTCYQVADGEF